MYCISHLFFSLSFFIIPHSCRLGKGALVIFTREIRTAKKSVYKTLKTLVASNEGFDGGEGEIRTLEPVSGLHDFQSCALDQLGDFSRSFLFCALS